jgi:hypothetical protein
MFKKLVKKNFKSCWVELKFCYLRAPELKICRWFFKILDR